MSASSVGYASSDSMPKGGYDYSLGREVGERTDKLSRRKALPMDREWGGSSHFELL